MTDKLTFVLDGDESLSFALVEDGTLTFGVSTPHSVAVDVYEGSYEVTPNAETQTLNTSGLMMSQGVTINPIPSNYGLITWNGSTLTVS